MTWQRYVDYVERHFRYVRSGDFIIGSVPYLWDKHGRTIKTLWLKIRHEPDVKQRLKFLLVEKLPKVWAQIPTERRPTNEEMEPEEGSS